MAVLGMIIVARALEVGWHHRYEIAPILAPVRFAQLDTGDLCNGIPFVRRLKARRSAIGLRSSVAWRGVGKCKSIQETLIFARRRDRRVGRRSSHSLAGAR
jgi:hypothetical protein